jgi:hypothetical protein
MARAPLFRQSATILIADALGVFTKAAAKLSEGIAAANSEHDKLALNRQQAREEFNARDSEDAAQQATLIVIRDQAKATLGAVNLIITPKVNE